MKLSNHTDLMTLRWMSFIKTWNNMMNMRIKVLSFILLFLIIFVPKAVSIEVSTLEAEKRLEFSELFPKRICDDIYNKSTFGVEKKLQEDVTLRNFYNLKRINLDEQKLATQVVKDQKVDDLEKEKLAAKILQQGLN